jgi:hypothetical protein
MTASAPVQPPPPTETTAARHCGTQSRPLMSTSSVMWRLDLNEDEVITLIEVGALRWAFNIASAAAKARAVRVLTESVEDLVYSRKRPGQNDETEWERVRQMIFPDKTTIVTYELARALNCSRCLVMDLIRARQFKVSPGSVIRRGPYGSPHIVTASAAAWLLKGRIS